MTMMNAALATTVATSPILLNPPSIGCRAVAPTPPATTCSSGGGLLRMSGGGQCDQCSGCGQRRCARRRRRQANHSYLPYSYCSAGKPVPRRHLHQTRTQQQRPQRSSPLSHGLGGNGNGNDDSEASRQHGQQQGGTVEEPDPTDSSSSSSFTVEKLEFTEKLYDLLNNVKLLQKCSLDILQSIDPIRDERVNGAMRDAAIRKLHYLHHSVYHRLSAETFCRAVAIVDNFIVQVRVKPKYMACVSAAAYSIACNIHERVSYRPNLRQLVNITQCGGTSKDMKRMMEIIHVKTHHHLLAGSGSTPVDFVNALFTYCEQCFGSTSITTSGAPDGSTSFGFNYKEGSGAAAASRCLGEDNTARLAAQRLLCRAVIARVNIGLTALGAQQYPPPTLALACYQLELESSAAQPHKASQQFAHFEQATIEAAKFMMQICEITGEELSACKLFMRQMMKTYCDQHSVTTSMLRLFRLAHPALGTAHRSKSNISAALRSFPFRTLDTILESSSE